MGFLGIIGLCYLIEILIVKPDWLELAPSIIIPHVNKSSIYVAMAILGANPHIFAKLRSFALNILRKNKVKNVSRELFRNCMDINRLFDYAGIF